MRRALALLVLAAAWLVTPSCSRAPLRHDVLLISIDGFDWSRTALDGGEVASPRLKRLAGESASLDGLVSPGPGGPPAALTLLSGLPPAEHGLRRLDGAPRSLRVPTLADHFGSRGWRTGAFLQEPLFGGLVDIASGFEAWMAPSESVPLGLPRMVHAEPARGTAAQAQHWLRSLNRAEASFTWVHFAAPDRPGLAELEVAAAMAEIDSLVGLLIDQVEERGLWRGVRPAVLVVSLSGRGPDAGTSLDRAFLLEDESVRVRALARVPDLPVGPVDALAGVDELHDLLASVAEPGRESRLRALARGQAPPREAVRSETLLPMTALGAQPIQRMVRAPGVTAPEPDPLLIQARAGDAGWPGGFRGPSAVSQLSRWRTLRELSVALLEGDPNAAAGLSELARSSAPQARAPKLLLALALASAGDGAAASELLGELAASAPPSDPAHRQALLALGEVERMSGRPGAARQALSRILKQHPDDLTALLQLGLACEQDGDGAAALAALSQALQARPRDARVLTATARIHSARGAHRLASAAYGDALKQRPVDGALLIAAAAAASEAGDPWTALERLDAHEVAFGPTADTLHRKGLVYHREARWANALTFHSRALDQDESFEPARLALADATLRNGNEEDGRAFLAVARVRSPSSAEPCRILVAWLQDEGRDAEARSELQSCLAQHPEDAGLRALAGATAGS